MTPVAPRIGNDVSYGEDDKAVESIFRGRRSIW